MCNGREDLIRTAKKPDGHFRLEQSSFSTISVSYVVDHKPAEIQYDVSLKYRLYFREPGERPETWEQNRMLMKARSKESHGCLVPFSFNKPVVQQPRDHGYDHSGMFLWNHCRTCDWQLAPAGLLCRVRPTAGACSAGISCQMGALW